MNKRDWISVKDCLPEKNGDEYSYLISDGRQIAIGWYEPEYFAEDPNEPIQYSSATWHEDSSWLFKDVSGFPEVKYWAELPALPNN